MHELAVTQSLVKTILTEIEKHQINNHAQVVVEMGLLTSYVKDSVLFYYDLLKQDIAALKDIDLIIYEIPGKIRCNSCKKEQLVKDPLMMFCSDCHSTNITIIQGKEFMIKKITVES